jgi:hypothetical protein
VPHSVRLRQPRKPGRISCISILAQGHACGVTTPTRLPASTTIATSGPAQAVKLEGATLAAWKPGEGTPRTRGRARGHRSSLARPGRRPGRTGCGAAGGWEGREGARGGHRLALHSSFFLGVFNAAPKRVLGFRGGTGSFGVTKGRCRFQKHIRGEHGPGRQDRLGHQPTRGDEVVAVALW